MARASEAVPFIEPTDGEADSHRSYDADDAEGRDGYRAFGYARHREIPEAIAEDGDDEADECSRQRHPQIGLEEAATHQARCEEEVVEVEDHDQIEVHEPRRVVESGIGEDRHLGCPLHGRHEGLQDDQYEPDEGVDRDGYGAVGGLSTHCLIGYFVKKGVR